MHHCWIAAELPPTIHQEPRKIYIMHVLRTGNAGSKSDKGNRVHSVLEVDEAAEMSSDISNDGGAGTDHEDGNDKGGVPIAKG